MGQIASEYADAPARSAAGTTVAIAAGVLLGSGSGVGDASGVEHAATPSARATIKGARVLIDVMVRGLHDDPVKATPQRCTRRRHPPGNHA
jgi:hypothetical protein